MSVDLRNGILWKNRLLNEEACGGSRAEESAGYPECRGGVWSTAAASVCSSLFEEPPRLDSPAPAVADIALLSAGFTSVVS